MRTEEAQAIARQLLAAKSAIAESTQALRLAEELASATGEQWAGSIAQALNEMREITAKLYSLESGLLKIIITTPPEERK